MICFLNLELLAIGFLVLQGSLSIAEQAFDPTTNPSPLRLSKQHTDLHEAEIKAPAHGSAIIGDFDDGRPGYEEPALITH
jgi:hypothetical protein